MTQLQRGKANSFELVGEQSVDDLIELCGLINLINECGVFVYKECLKEFSFYLL